MKTKLKAIWEIITGQSVIYRVHFHGKSGIVRHGKMSFHECRFEDFNFPILEEETK